MHAFRGEQLQWQNRLRAHQLARSQPDRRLLSAPPAVPQEQPALTRDQLHRSPNAATAAQADVQQEAAAAAAAVPSGCGAAGANRRLPHQQGSAPVGKFDREGERASAAPVEAPPRQRVDEPVQFPALGLSGGPVARRQLENIGNLLGDES